MARTTGGRQALNRGRVAGRPAGRSRAAPRSPLFFSTSAFIATWLLFGGGNTSPYIFCLLALSGSWLLAHVAAAGGLAAWGGLPRPAQAAIAFFCLMPVLQCVPLPPGLWHALPGRQIAAETLALAGAAQGWHPLSLTVGATAQSALLSIWLVGLLLAALTLSADELRDLLRLLLGLGALHLAFGILQVASRGAFQLYPGDRTSYLLGLFANKNHSGLFIALLFPIGYLALYGEGWGRSRLPLAAGASLMLFAAAILTFSRAGMLFAGMALAALIFLANERRIGRPGRYAVAALLAAAALLALLGSTDLAARALGRFGGVGTDPRWQFWSWSWPLVPGYFPFGSGIGSFPDVFKVHEQLAWVKPTYLNHAHNEYLEQLIEVGIAAPILWALVILMLAGRVRTAWRQRERTSGRVALVGAGMVVLTLLHSAFDYPLRRPALAAVFVLALAMLLRAAAERKPIA